MSDQARGARLDRVREIDEALARSISWEMRRNLGAERRHIIGLLGHEVRPRLEAAEKARVR